MAALVTAADARPVKKKVHRHTAAAASVVVPDSLSGDQDPRYPGLSARQKMAAGAAAVAGVPEASAVRGRKGRTARTRAARAQAVANASQASFGGFGGSSLVAEARKYIGTNPTGRGSLWCGAFMDLVLKRTGHAGGGNLARAYANYGRRVSGPQVGAIAVLTRRGGGHVGVVSGVDANGNPIVISGNHNRTTAESVYPRSRVVAYVMPN
jgi:uncharacterized protein (TIGR02594 family)